MSKLISILLITIFSAAYISLHQLIFADSELVKIEGQLKKVNQFIKKETNDEFYGYLTFMMKDDRRFYHIKLKIDSLHQNTNLLGGVYNELALSGQMNVYIKRGDFNIIRPKVYRLEADEKNIFEIKNLPGNNSQLYLILTLCSIMLIILYNVAILKRNKGTDFRNWA